MSKDFQSLVRFVRDCYHTKEPIPLHAPVFAGNEQAYVSETLVSTFVSSVGPFVDRFEEGLAAFTGAPAAVATVNGTAALHMALLAAGVEEGGCVITYACSPGATCTRWPGS